jgi:hypothetical protein
MGFQIGKRADKGLRARQTELSEYFSTDASERLVRQFNATNNQQKRVVTAFAAIALAGELATQWAIVPWNEDDATRAAKTAKPAID